MCLNLEILNYLWRRWKKEWEVEKKENTILAKEESWNQGSKAEIKVKKQVRTLQCCKKREGDIFRQEVKILTRSWVHILPYWVIHTSSRRRVCFHTLQSVHRETCGVTNSDLWLPGCWKQFILVWITEAGFQMPSAINSNSHCFCLFSPGTMPHMTGFAGSCCFSPLQLSLRITQLLSHLQNCWQHTLGWVPAMFY